MERKLWQLRRDEQDSQVGTTAVTTFTGPSRAALNCQHFLLPDVPVTVRPAHDVMKNPS